MVEPNIAEFGSDRHHEGKHPKAIVFVSIDVFENHIVNAVAFPPGRGSFCIGQHVRELHTSAHVRNPVVAERYIHNLAKRTNIGTLILGCEKNRESFLGKTTPRILQDVSFEQQPLGILEFENVFHDKWFARSSSDEAGLPGFPGHGLVHMITADLDVGRRCCRWSTAEDNVLTGGLKEVVDDFVWSAGDVTSATPNVLCIYTCPGHGHTVKI